MELFRTFRPNPPEGYVEGGYANAPNEVQLQGVVFDDGTVCVRWLTEHRSHSIWTSFDEFMAVHGHPEYGTIVQWWDWLSNKWIGGPDNG